MDKVYNVVIKKDESLEELDAELASSKGSETIPKRPVTMGNPLLGNSRVTRWKLSDKEVEALRKDKRVQAVQNITSEETEFVGSGSVKAKMLRPSNGINLEMEAYEIYNAGDDTPVVNWGLGRHQNFKDENLKTVSSKFYKTYDDMADRPSDAPDAADFYGTYGDVYNYDYDGEGVDVIILDSGIHAESPEWNDKDGNSRLQQIDWAALAAQHNVPLVDDEGDPITQADTFYTDTIGHGTSVASAAVGFRCGAAKGATIYSIKLNVGGLSDGFDPAVALTLVGIFHQNKGNNRPTVINLSYATGHYVSNYPEYGIWRGQPWYKFATTVGDEWDDIEAIDYTTQEIQFEELAYRYGLYGMNGNYNITSSHGDGTFEPQTLRLPIKDEAVDATLDALIDMGVHVCIAGNNDGFKQDIDPNDPDYVIKAFGYDDEGLGADWDNACYATSMHTLDNTKYYYNRPSSPHHAKAFRVGALNNEKGLDFKLTTLQTSPYVVRGIDWHSDEVSNYTDMEGEGTYFPFSTRNLNELKTYFSPHGAAINMWGAGQGLMLEQPAKISFEAADTKNSYFHDTNHSGLYATNWNIWSGLFNKDKGNKGVKVSHDIWQFDTDIVGEQDYARFKITLEQDFIDELLAAGHTHIHTLRTWVHYKASTEKGQQLSEIFDETPNQFGNFDTLVNYRVPNFRDGYHSTNVPPFYSVTSADVDVEGSSGGDRPSFVFPFSFPDVPKTASEFKANFSKGVINLTTIYSDYTDNDAAHVAQPIDLTEEGLADRVLYEIVMPVAELPEGIENIDDTFSVGATVVNAIYSGDAHKLVDDTMNLGYPAYKGSIKRQTQGTSFSSPMVAGLVACNLEAEGNKTPTEMLEFMSQPYSTPDKSAYPESGDIGFSKTKAAPFLEADRLEYERRESYLDNPEHFMSFRKEPLWHNWYAPVASVMKFDNGNNLGSFDYLDHQPHNYAIVGNKTVAAVPKVKRQTEKRIKGELYYHSGKYSTFLSYTPSQILEVYGHIAEGESIDLSGTMFGISYFGTTGFTDEDGNDVIREQRHDWLTKTPTANYVEDGNVVPSTVGDFSDVTHSIEFDIQNAETRFTYNSYADIPADVYRHNKTVDVKLGMEADLGYVFEDAGETFRLLPPAPTFLDGTDTVDINVQEDDDATEFPILYTVQPNIQQFTLNLQNNLYRSHFEIVNGVSIRATQPFDRETDPVKFVKLELSDQFGRTSELKQINFNVVDVNDTPPVAAYEEGDIPFSNIAGINSLVIVEEHNIGEQVIFKLSQVDPDLVGNHTYTLKMRDQHVTNPVNPFYTTDWQNDPTLPFIYDQVNQEVRVPDNCFDYETVLDTQSDRWITGNRQYTFLLEVSDGEQDSVTGQGSRNTEPKIYVTVGDETEEAPRVSGQRGGTVEVTDAPDLFENHQLGTVVYDISSMVDNEPENGNITYEAVVVGTGVNPNGYDNSKFIVNEQGQVILNAPLDYETHTNANITIRVKNRWSAFSGEHSTQVSIDFNILDVFDSRPRFADGNGGFSNDFTTDVNKVMDEHPAVGTVIHEFTTDLEGTVSFAVSNSSASNPLASYHQYFEIQDANGNAIDENTPVTYGKLVALTSEFPDVEADESISHQNNIAQVNYSNIDDFNYIYIMSTNENGTNRLRLNVTIQDSTVDNYTIVEDTFEVVGGSVSGTPIGTLAFDIGFSDMKDKNSDPNSTANFLIAPHEIGVDGSVDSSVFGFFVLNDIDVDLETGSMVLNTNIPDTPTEAQRRFYVIAEHEPTGSRRVFLITVNFVAAAQPLQEMTMVTGLLNYWGSWYGWDSGHYYIGSMNGQVDTEIFVNALYPSALYMPRLCHLWWHNPTGVQAKFTKAYGDPHQGNELWTTLDIDGVSYDRANASISVYQNDTRYTWSTSTNPFPSVGVTHNIKWF